MNKKASMFLLNMLAFSIIHQEIFLTMLYVIQILSVNHRILSIMHLP